MAKGLSYNQGSTVIAPRTGPLAIERDHKTKPTRRRSTKACLGCRARKVRCNVAEHGSPCTNCRLDILECVVRPRRKMRRGPDRMHEQVNSPNDHQVEPMLTLANAHHASTIAQEFLRSPASTLRESLAPTPKEGLDSTRLEITYNSCHDDTVPRTGGHVAGQF